MSAALVSAIRDLSGICKALHSSGSSDYQQHMLAFERQLSSQLGQYRLPSSLNFAVSAGKHPALSHSHSVSVPIACPKNGHRKLDRSVSEPVERSLQQLRPVQPNSSRYKTELCRPFEESGTCKYGDKCQFAHGSNELRTLARHPKYKTELCRTFHSTGFCPYGPRCHFIHNDVAKSLLLGSSGPRVGPQRHPSGDFDVGSFSGELSPNSSISGSPTSSSGFYTEDTTSAFSSPAPPFLANSCFFEQDVVPFAPPNQEILERRPYLSASPVDVLSASLDSLNLSDMPISGPPLDLNRNLRLPIFNRLAFVGRD